MDCALNRLWPLEIILNLTSTKNKISTNNKKKKESFSVLGSQINVMQLFLTVANKQEQRILKNCTQ